MTQYKLITFGGLAVTTEDGETVTGPEAQKRRVALLVLLAAARKRGQTRDALISYL